MEDTAKLDPTSIEFCERRIEQLKSQKRKLEMITTKNFAEQADRKCGKKRCEEVKSLLERKVKNPETRKKMVQQADQEDANKHAKRVGSLEKAIKFMEMRKECIIMAAERSISVEAAQELVEQEEMLKDKEQPAGEWMQEYTRVLDHNGREYLDRWYTAIIVLWDVHNKTAMIVGGGCFDHDIDDKSKSKIFVHYPYMEDGLIEAKLLFFSEFYQLSLLEVAFQGMLLDVPTQIPTFGSTHPKCGDEVFSLGRDKDLVVRHGTIMKDGCLIELRQGYLFLDYELPEGGIGGPAVDHQGDVVGIVMDCDDDIAIILPISIVLSCFRMWTNCRRIACPLLGMSCRNAEPLDSRSGDIRFDALVVTEVDPKSAAWKQGIRSGNVIVSFDEQPPKPLPEFEVFLLSLGLKHLHGTHTEVDFKLEVQDPDNVQRSITLHVPFSDVANVLS